MLKTIEWTVTAWEQYVYWQTQDKKTLRKINGLIEAVIRNPFEGDLPPRAMKLVIEWATQEQNELLKIWNL